MSLINNIDFALFLFFIFYSFYLAILDIKYKAISNYKLLFLLLLGILSITIKILFSNGIKILYNIALTYILSYFMYKLNAIGPGDVIYTLALSFVYPLSKIDKSIFFPINIIIYASFLSFLYILALTNIKFFLFTFLSWFFIGFFSLFFIIFFFNKITIKEVPFIPFLLISTVMSLFYNDIWGGLIWYKL
ncbi:MAG: prepilin peptidase [Nitrososphaerota archaeon]